MTPLDVNSGDTAWILTSAALVLLMTPGLALFYGGMVRAKTVLNMMMMSFGALASISVVWVLWGYSMAFGDDVGGGLLGNPFQYFGLRGLMEDTGASLPTMAFVGLPGRVRDHHRRPDLRRDRRPRQVGHLDDLHGHLGDHRLLPGRALGLRLQLPGRRRPRHPLRRLDRQQPQGDRLRRWHRGPHQRRCRGPRAGDRPGSSPRLAARPDAPAQPHPGHARRRPAVVRLVRLQRRFRADRRQLRLGRLGQHLGRDRRRRASPG